MSTALRDPDEAAVLSCRGVVKEFGDTAVLRGIDLDVGEHQVVTLIGASGSGKSTLLRCIDLLEVVQDGVITLEGQDITGPRVDADLVRRRIGMVFQGYNLFPDLTVLGKAMGAGLPIGAVSGTRDAMTPLRDGTVRHRGTFNGNPLCVAAAIACIRTLRDQAATLFPRMERHAAALAGHVNAEAARLGVAACAQQVGPALQLFAGVRHLDGIRDLGRVDPDATLRLTEGLLRRGVQTIPRGLMYLSAAHGDAEIEATMGAITGALAGIDARQQEHT